MKNIKEFEQEYWFVLRNMFESTIWSCLDWEIFDYDSFVNNEYINFISTNKNEKTRDIVKETERVFN